MRIKATSGVYRALSKDVVMAEIPREKMEVANVKTDSLLEQILSAENLNNAYKQVKRNKGAAGVDEMKVNEPSEHMKANGELFKEQIRKRKYKPLPVRRIEIPKADGGIRNLGVPTIYSTEI